MIILFVSKTNQISGFPNLQVCTCVVHKRCHRSVVTKCPGMRDEVSNKHITWFYNLKHMHSFLANFSISFSRIVNRRTNLSDSVWIYRIVFYHIVISASHFAIIAVRCCTVCSSKDYNAKFAVWMCTSGARRMSPTIVASIPRKWPKF